MSNMYGYSDYNGPTITNIGVTPSSTDAVLVNTTIKNVVDNEDSDIMEDPLQVGFWMEGDSLAPPCGTSVPTVHKLLEFAKVTSSDVLYDLGCGDGRICLEAYARYGCQTIGVEVEQDLVNRANELISTRLPIITHTILPQILCRDLRSVLQELVDVSKGQNHLLLPNPSIIILYLLPEALDELKDQFVILLDNFPEYFRIVCNTWGLPGLTCRDKTQISEDGSALTSFYLYTKDSLSTNASNRA